ncbi:TATA box-binding protein-associated factor RNA polymerase I subunit B [Ooceraea biroi]|uniref:TATA box-binding protein-associated factor RNA polymerase I subunit B n=1 Tax=Ooceraea biroi TaxID=2015173 RepID=UPI000F07A688|nr:TATA box-binding protein-associated factor RNA polymerase I subunit B [Ooceraea biroi]
MLTCVNCGCTDFYKESGYFFCTTCQMQSQDAGQELQLDLPMQINTKLRKTRIRRMGSDKTEDEIGWTSWELYNFVMIGLTNELIELGASADIKATVLQLWARYLGRLEVAFVSKKKRLIPKLSRRFKKRDAVIIYGKVLSQKKAKKQRRSGSNVTDFASTCPSQGTSMKELNRNKKLMITADYDRFVQSQASSEGDALSTFNSSIHSFQSSSARSSENGRIQFSSSAKEERRKVKNMAKKISRQKRSKYKQSHVTTRYKISPELITPMKLWAILYLALRIHNQDIHLGDMIRYGREGHLSYYKFDHLIPPEVALTRDDVNFLSRAADITHKGMRSIIGKMAEFLGVTKIICPDFLSFIVRYCNELHLPRGISLYAERLVALSPPKMTFDRRTCIPNYEGRAIAFIIVVMKTLLGLDGITEYEISKVAASINSAIDNEGICDFKLFNFREWQDYVECRRAVLVNAHYPTKLKHNPDVPDVNSLYIKYLESMRSKSDREEPEITTGHKHLIPRELVHAMKHCVTNIDYIDVPLNDVNEFSPSLTPHHSYLQQLLEHPSWDLPSILRNDFFSTKIGYMTKPDLVCKLAVQYNIPLDIIDSNLHFVEKIVPFFEQAKMANMKELKDNVEIQDCLEEDMETSEKKESFIEYLHKKIPCRFKIDPKKKQYYDNSCNRTINTETPPLISSDEFIFNEVLPNGKLAIPDEIGGDESEDDDTYSEDVPRETRVLTKFCKAYDIHFSSTEKKALLGHSRQVKKQKRKLSRNVHGKFVKQDDDSRGAENPDEDDCYEEQIEMVLADDFKVDSVLPEISDILNMNDDMSNRFDDLLKNEYDDQDKRHDEMFKLATDNSAFASDTKLYDDTLRLCRPFTDYWMYHCNFSRVKPKNFELFEKMLPRGFRWLLNECANVVEMSTEDLYEEVCLVEAYHAYLSEQFESCVPTASSNPNYSQNRAYVNAILKKW